MFNALLIASTAYNDRGRNLWADNYDMKKILEYQFYMKL